MAPMAKEFYNSEDFKVEKDWLDKELKIDVTDSTFATNLEIFELMPLDPQETGAALTQWMTSNDKS